MLERTDLMSMTLPARFNQVAPQLLILFLILSIRGSQEEAFGAVLKMGTPRYLKSDHWEVPFMPRILLMSARSLGDQFQE